MKKVVFVDSSKTSVFLIENAISKFENISIEAIFYENSIHFLDYLKSNRPDVVVTAMHMAYKNGLEVIKEVKKVDKDIPVMVLSSSYDEDLYKKAVELGSFGWLNKPFESDCLENMLTQIIG